jgi:hypothetical protein
MRLRPSHLRENSANLVPVTTTGNKPDLQIPQVHQRLLRRPNFSGRNYEAEANDPAHLFRLFLL